MVFKSGGWSSRLRDHSFLGGRRALLCGGGRLDAARVSKAGAFFKLGVLQHHLQEKEKIFCTPYIYGRWLPPRSQKATGSGDGDS